MELRIDEEFKNLIKPPTSEEYRQLEENILEEGLRDPIIIWGDIIVDGHNRYSICQAHGIEPRTFSKEFESRAHVKEWIIKNQFGRRNLPTNERLRLAMILEDSIKERARQNQGTRTDISQQVGKSDPIHTDDEIGALAGVSRETVRRYRKIQDEAPEEIREKVNAGEMTVSKGYEISMEPSEKVCTICGILKPRSGFPKKGNACKSCTDEMRQEASELHRWMRRFIPEKTDDLTSREMVTAPTCDSSDQDYYQDPDEWVESEDFADFYVNPVMLVIRNRLKSTCDSATKTFPGVGNHAKEVFCDRLIMMLRELREEPYEKGE